MAILLNYLSATGMKLGILVNFGHYPKIEYERLILTPGKENFYEQQAMNSNPTQGGWKKKALKDSS